MPSSWNNYELNGTFIHGKGYATLRLKLLLPHNIGECGLKFLTMNTAYSAYVDNRLVASAGIAGTDSISTVPKYKPQAVFFRPQSDTVNLILYVSNFRNAKGGPWMPIEFGTASTIAELHERSLASEQLFLGGILLVGLYHLMLFLIKRRNIAMLWFSVLCLTVGLRLALTGERILQYSFQNQSWATMLWLEYQTLFFAPAIFSLFLHALFPNEFRKKISVAIVAVAAGCSIVSIVAPVEIYSQIVPAYELFIVAIAAYMIFACTLAAKKRRSGAKVILFGSALVAIAAINDSLYDQSILQFVLMTPASLVVMVILQSYLLAVRYAEDYKRVEDLSSNLRKINRSLNRFVPGRFVNFLDKSDITAVKPGDQVCMETSVLYADIRSFTTISERMSPAETFTFLNHYLENICPPIISNGGFIDKFIGDGVFAVFPEGPQGAVTAAIKMQKAVETFNKNAGFLPISIGIGLHRGNAVFGTIGDSRRMETAIISDSIHMTSKIESMTKLYGVRTILSRHFANSIPADVPLRVRLLDKIILPGRSTPFEIVELLEGLQEEEMNAKLSTKNYFEAGVVLFCQEEYRAAARLFQRVLFMHGYDRTAMILLARCESVLNGEPIKPVLIL